jgi:hypothetical protein
MLVIIIIIIVNLLMQHKFPCVNLIGRSWKRQLKNEPNNTHLASLTLKGKENGDIYTYILVQLLQVGSCWAQVGYFNRRPAARFPKLIAVLDIFLPFRPRAGLQPRPRTPLTHSGNCPWWIFVIQQKNEKNNVLPPNYFRKLPSYKGSM